SALWSSGDAVNAVTAVVGVVAAVVALRSVAVSRSLPHPEPVVGPRSHRAQPRLAQTLTFFTIAGGLHFCLLSTATVAGFPFELGAGYTTWPLGMCVFTIGGLVLGVVTLDAVTSRHLDRRAVAGCALDEWTPFDLRRQRRAAPPRRRTTRRYNAVGGVIAAAGLSAAMIVRK